MSLKSFGAVLRFYHISSKLRADKYITRLKQRAEISRRSFERKKGRALILADHDPASVLRLASVACTSHIKEVANPHLSLKAPHRVAFALHQMVRQTTAIVLARLGIPDQIDIIDVDLCKGFSEIHLTWKRATNAPSPLPEIDLHLERLAEALKNELVELNFTSMPPAVSLHEFSPPRSNVDQVNALLKQCNLGSDSDLASTPAEGLSIKPPKSKESLRELINHDLGAIRMPEVEYSDEQHTFQIKSRGKSRMSMNGANVYGLDRDSIMAKVSSSRRKS